MLTIGSIHITIPEINLSPVDFIPKFGISGFSCKFLPITCPTYSRMTLKPFFSTYSWIEYPMSPTLIFSLIKGITLELVTLDIQSKNMLKRMVLVSSVNMLDM